MRNEILFFTAGQFAKLHGLNKRTLHYYDEIGLFSPAHKGNNGYRYYTYHQSVELENILALRELGMSIEEIKTYLRQPNPEDFSRIATQKVHEIDEQMQQLRGLKALLLKKLDNLTVCQQVYDGKIAITWLQREFLLLTPMQLQEADFKEMRAIMEHLQTAWECNAYKTGCGSYISLAKVRRGDWESYDGLFTPVSKPASKGQLYIRPAGDYLCGYAIGSWDKLPALYRQMLDFAHQEGLELTGDCYEIGLNEFAISRPEEYITQVAIRISSS